MEEYIKLEEEKARRRGKVYNWETAKYDKIWYDEDVHDLKSIETEFSAIVFNDGLSSEKTLSCEPTISFLNNNEIDFRISFDESDDEDYTVIFDKNSYFDDCDFLKDFEKEFTAIAYNDALTSKLDFLTEPTMTPQHIDEFDLKNETSLSECDEEEQNVLYFNDLFPFNISIRHMALSPRDPEHNTFLGLHTAEEMETAGFGLYWAESGRQISNKGDLSAYWREISSEGGISWLITCSIVGRSQAPEKVTVSDLFYLRGMDVGSVNVPYLLSKYLSLFASRRKQGAMISGGQFVNHLAEHFGLFTKERLHGLTVIIRDLPIIDMAELLRLHICEKLNDMLKEEVHELRQSNVGLRGDVDRSITDQSGLAQLIDASGRTYQAFDSTLVGSLRLPYQRRTRRRTGDANTSTT
ncbi:hypothetical protein Tco_1102437 [Tanacetum coccineum]